MNKNSPYTAENKIRVNLNIEKFDGNSEKCQEILIHFKSAIHYNNEMVKVSKF